MSKPAGSTSGYLSGRSGVQARSPGRAGRPERSCGERSGPEPGRGAPLACALRPSFLQSVSRSVWWWKEKQFVTSESLGSPSFWRGGKVATHAASPPVPRVPSSPAPSAGRRGRWGRELGRSSRRRLNNALAPNSGLRRRAEATLRKADFEWNALHPVSSYFK